MAILLNVATSYHGSPAHPMTHENDQALLTAENAKITDSNPFSSAIFAFSAVNLMFEQFSKQAPIIEFAK
jgi:hypothetical protein